ncbi:MAG: hypothetical protein QGF28_00710 [Candidatus Thalassarchaeaceae archaeon]|nr:hypothetical protein [Candidatus Thalassarchaeaceae archaeon]
MSGSSVAAMVVGTIFIMIFGMATVSMIESIDDSVKVAEFKLPNPEVDLTEVTDKVEATGPVLAITEGDVPGSDYPDGPVTCTTTHASGTGLTVSVTAVAGQVTDATIVDAGDGYETGADTVLISYCVGTEDGLATLDIDSLHEQITINITNTGSEAVELNRIYITLSDTGDYNQGIPFQFSSHYYGSNLFIFPGEYIESSPFGLENTTHGLAVDADPDRAFLSVYDYSSAIPVTDS